jgi:hypothetical protein
MFAALCLALLVAIAVAYRVRGAEQRRAGAPNATSPAPPKVPTVGWAEFIAAVSQIKKGQRVLVEDSLRALVPPGAIAERFADHLTFPHPWVIPDRRSNPAEADYILSHDVFDLRSMLFGPSPLWEIVAAYQGSTPPYAYLARRKAPIERQLLPELSDEALHRGLREMVKIDWGKTPGDDHHGHQHFYLDRYAVTHELFARFLNDLGISPEELHVYYSIKDPTSRVVYYRNRYLVYRGSERLPIYNVSWYGATAFCEYYGQRLATIQEWAKASGYTDDVRKYPWGNQTDFANRANFRGDADGYAFWAPVDAFPLGVSRYGLYNMAGNVAEWTEPGYVVGGGFELGPEAGLNSEKDTNYALARNLHDGFRCAADEAPR